MATVQPDPRPYELMTVLVPELGDEDLAGQLDQLNSQIAASGGSVTETLRESPWGRRRLAYPIRHNGQDFRDGYYVVTHFTLPPGQTTDLERDLKLNVQIIRYLLVHDDPKAGERARDPELVVEHSDDPQAVQPVEVAATTAEVLRDPDEVESDPPTVAAAAEAEGDQPAATTTAEAETDAPAAPDASAAEPEIETPAQDVDSAEELAPAAEATLAEEPPVESQATPPPANASNLDEETQAESATTDEEPARQADKES